MYRINNVIMLENVIAAWEPPLAEFIYTFVADDATGHDIYHCLRVKHLALRIAEGESLDQDIMVTTAYLHDIGRNRERLGKGDHVDTGIAAAQEILPRIPFPPEKIPDVIRCIEYHEEYEWIRNRQEIDRESNREVFGFQDADRLDAIGAIGLARMFCFGGAYQQPLWIPEEKPGFWQHGEISSSTYNHLYEKLFKLRDAMNTATGRRLAVRRHRFMEQFAHEFEQEWVGAI